MKSTAALSIHSVFSMDETSVNIHPNDGFDLGFMTTEHPVMIYVGGEAQGAEIPATRYARGRIFLKNEVRGGCMELGRKAVEKLGGARKARILLEEGGAAPSLRIVPV